jgi:hypothetical protein
MLDLVHLGSSDDDDDDDLARMMKGGSTTYRFHWGRGSIVRVHAGVGYQPQ